MKIALPQKQNKLTFFALLCASLGIWGYVLYLITQGMSGAEDSFDFIAPIPAITASTSEPAHREPASTIAYEADFRDPFAMPDALFVPRRRHSGPAKPPSEPPPLRLSGVVGETALLQGEDGSVFMVRSGESTGGAKILSVQRDQVLVRYQGRSYTLDLNH